MLADPSPRRQASLWLVRNYLHANTAKTVSRTETRGGRRVSVSGRERVPGLRSWLKKIFLQVPTDKKTSIPVKSGDEAAQDVHITVEALPVDGGKEKTTGERSVHKRQKGSRPGSLELKRRDQCSLSSSSGGAAARRLSGACQRSCAAPLIRTGCRAGTQGT